jgi:hypothetical protein
MTLMRKETCKWLVQVLLLACDACWVHSPQRLLQIGQKGQLKLVSKHVLDPRCSQTHCKLAIQQEPTQPDTSDPVHLHDCSSAADT